MPPAQPLLLVPQPRFALLVLVVLMLGLGRHRLPAALVVLPDADRAGSGAPRRLFTA